MQIFCFARLGDNLYLSKTGAVDIIADGNDDFKTMSALRAALYPVACELIMEHAKHAVISSDYKAAHFIMDVVMMNGDMPKLTITFTQIKHYTIEITINLAKAHWPERGVFAGKYISAPISAVLVDTTDPSVELLIDMFYGNVPLVEPIVTALKKNGRYDIAVKCPMNMRPTASNSCEASAMDN